jgi:hypothetical protein
LCGFVGLKTTWLHLQPEMQKDFNQTYEMHGLKGGVQHFFENCVVM